MEVVPINVETPKRQRRSDGVKVLDDGTVMKLQKSRQRRILSCVHCHSKKIKCSRVHPTCNNCSKLGIACKYFINERVSKGGRRKNVVKKENDQDTLLPSQSTATSMNSRTLSESSESARLQTSEGHEKRSSRSSASDMEDKELNLEVLSKKSPDIAQDSPLGYLPLNLSYFQKQGLVGVVLPEMVPPNVLQTPILNQMSNNITNNFFGTNYAHKALPQEELASQLSQAEEYTFNLSTFAFANEMLNAKNLPLTDKVDEGKPGSELHSRVNSSSNLSGMYRNTNSSGPPKNFLDTPSEPVVPINYSQKNSQPNNPGLHNSLNAYSSNPATTVNYLYGTNTYYDNENLLTDLLTHLPNSRARSSELLERYINSVHILLPILVNLNEFVKEHERYWDLFDPYKNSSSSPSASSLNSDSTSPHAKDFNLLQFYTLYFPVLYASTISEFEEYDNLLLNQDIAKYLKGFNKICQYYNYPHGIKTMPLLLGNVIIQSTSPNPSTMEMSQIIRYAKFMQLHKDPVISLRIQDWKVVKFRRLLWWVIFGLDALSSHNFCLPPVCKFDDFNVVMPDEEDPVMDENGSIVKKTLNVSILALQVKFKFDRILSELVYELHNGLSTNITPEETDEIKRMIVQLFHFIHKVINKMTTYHQSHPPKTVQEINLLNFIKNHSWSFVDRALMLLHKKILLRDPQRATFDGVVGSRKETALTKDRETALSLGKYEDTFGRIQEANIVSNFDSSSISQLRFNQHELFTYENLQNNLIPSILHNLNDFLKYNDFIKFGKYNWYVKRTIPLDSIILLFIIMCVKFKYEFMTVSELVIYVKLINKALFILNRKYFKNEKYKRMLSLTNLTWEYILKKYNVIKLVSVVNEKNPGRIEFFDYQVSGYMNMSELFNTMDVPQPALISNGVNLGSIQHEDSHTFEKNSWEDELRHEEEDFQKVLNQSVFLNRKDPNEGKSLVEIQTHRHELLQLNEKIYYDLRNNFVDINDYCTFYSSLENVLHELMDYINDTTKAVQAS